jgi:hypothetical protein
MHTSTNFSQTAPLPSSSNVPLWLRTGNSQEEQTHSTEASLGCREAPCGGRLSSSLPMWLSSGSSGDLLKDSFTTVSSQNIHSSNLQGAEASSHALLTAPSYVTTGRLGSARVPTANGRVRTGRRESHGTAGMQQFALLASSVVGGLDSGPSQTNVLLC